MSTLKRAIVFFLITNSPVLAQTPISKSFELRYFTSDSKASGETDFKGETEYFNTAQRVEYLAAYEKYAQQFFNNPNWNKLVITDDEAKQIASEIKPQPSPKVRNRIQLQSWQCLGYKVGQHEERLAEIDKWNSNENVSVIYENLLFEKNTELSIAIPKQQWRSLFKLSVFVPKNGAFTWTLGDAVQVNQQDIPQNKWVAISIDLDLENAKYNLTIDGRKIVDFKPTSSTHRLNTLTFKGSKGVRLDNIHCVQYTKGKFTKHKNSRDIPYTINTFLLEDFRLKPEIKGWQTLSYDDSLWETREIPYPHGGERFKDESLYMRKIVSVADFKVAELSLETIDPGGEIWINGEVVHVQQNRHPVKIDISKYLKPNQDNILGVRVYPNRVKHTNRHTPADEYTGAFTGRSWLDFRNDRYIDDLFIYTSSIDDTKATVRLTAELRNDDWQFVEREVKKMQEFNGQLKLKIFKWFPKEEEMPVAQQTYPVNVRLYHNFKLEKDIEINNPDLWTFRHPNLYKVVCTLEDELGNKLDDYVTTTGIRTISQEGGTFRINGLPEMMNGALLFGYKYPLEDISRTVRCAEEYWLVKEMEMIKRMNANTIRMSVHHGMNGGINDPRIAEIGDQLGIMFQWTTSTWIRTGTPWALDFVGLPKYVRQVRNHPSIIMWQVGNHPKFKGYENEALGWMTQVYDGIYPNDPSRFIVPVGASNRLGDGLPNDSGTLNLRGDTLTDKTVWSAPMICRGNFDHTTSYGADWQVLRQYPFPKKYDGDMGWREIGFRTDYLNSKERAYFDYESEESVGQPNWELRKGKPSYRIKSYELTYDEGSIGRQLSVDEWRASQAWQGFSAYEAYRKKRWLDYDGQAWCTLHGGGNTATYQKPLIDYFGYSKIAWHSVKMAFQSVLAGSKNVDIVYGKDDKIPIVVMNGGDEKKVNLQLTIKTPQGKVVAEREFLSITLKAGRTFADVVDLKPELNSEGYYIFEYEVQKIENPE